MRFIVGGNGWNSPKGFMVAGTVVDDGLTQAGRLSQIPPDATAADQVTYDYMTSNGFPGLGYRYEVVKALPGIRILAPPFGRVLVAGSGQRLGGGGVLG